MGYRQRCGNTEERGWRNGFGSFAIVFGRGWPEDWKEGIIIPIVKKGEGDRVGDYRGVTLMPTIYKLYVAILAERVREEVEKERIVHNQTGFRKGMGAIYT